MQKNNHEADGSAKQTSGSSLRQRPGFLGLMALVFTLLAPAVLAQTVVISPQTVNYWTGINIPNALGVGTNTVTIGSGNGLPVNYAITGVPSGLTTLLSTNTSTNSVLIGSFLYSTNVAAGSYSLTFAATGAASYSTNINLFVVPQWTVTNNTANWSSSGSWSGGFTPGANNSVYIENQTGGFTNIVDSTRSIQDLVLLGDRDANLAAGSVSSLQIPTGVTLSVLGTNGFIIGNKTSNAARPWYDFSGAGTLVVSNPVANFVADNAASSTRFDTVRMTNLNNLQVTVSRFGVGDISLAAQGLYGANLMNFSLARTNVITALFSDNYTNLTFNGSIQYMAQNETFSGASQLVDFDLGISNLFQADSFIVGKNKSTASGTTPFSDFGPTLRVLPAFSNSIAPTASVFLRNTNGGRMSLFGVGIDSGTNSTGSSTKGVVDFRGAVLNASIDQVWLGRDRTNATAVSDLGGLFFDWGTLNANTVIAGDEYYTNGAACEGFILVGTNGTLVVNNNLMLGYNPTNITGFSSAAQNAFGQLYVTNGGTALINQVSVGLYGTNNIITIASGGNMVLSNTIASPSAGLTTLNLAGGLSLAVTSGTTNAYVNNLITSGNATINIFSLSGFASYPATNVLIAYTTPGTHNIGIGTLPPGFNNLQLVDNTGSQTINLIINTNAPKTLTWHGGQNSHWDHASLNWVDQSNNVVHFTDGDSVTFNDTAGVPTNITVSEQVNPGQTVTGITVSNSINQFVFNNNGGGAIGSTTLIKAGTGSLEVDCPTTVSALINSGTFTGAGSVNSVILATNTLLNFNGTINGSLTIGGTGTIASSGIVNGAATLVTGGVLTNSGGIDGTLTMQSGTFLDNIGLLYNVGVATVATNATLLNYGVIYGSTLTINGTLIDDAQDSVGVQAGSINVSTLLVNGTFMPGGSQVGTTAVTDFNNQGNLNGNPNGRIQLNTGSYTTLFVNLTNSQPYTSLLSQNQGFGPSQSVKSINGCTLVITNVGPVAFSAGQTFKFFGEYYDNGNINGAGNNTTNSYPYIQPASPGPGLAWDLSQLIPGGTISVITVASAQTTLTNKVTFVGGTNIINELSWPSNYQGIGWLQQQVTTTAVGLTTNWTTVPSSVTNYDIMITNTLPTNAAVFYRFVVP